jgi:hypothetical protein
VEAKECPAADVHGAERRPILFIEGEGAETVLTTTMGVETASSRLLGNKQRSGSMTLMIRQTIPGSDD